jgi:thioredoxin-related protein
MSRRQLFTSVFLFMIFVFSFTGVLGAREKTEKIGNISWYTEQNTFEEIVNIAKKENKPILAVFSATWCGPCRDVKQRVFSSDDFQKAADRVVLLYIEQTDPKSAGYLKKYKINAFPTFKIFSKEGIELDGRDPNRTLAGFLEWIDDVKAGNSYYELSLELKKEPDNRELILKLEDRISWLNLDERIQLLKRAIQLKPDFNDPLSQEAYEKLASALCTQMVNTREEEDRIKYARENNREFMAIIKAYYPDKFKYQLKENRCYYYLFRWLNTLGEHKELLSYFDDFLKKRGNKIDIGQDINLFPQVFSSMLQANREKDAEAWLTKLQDLVTKDINTAAEKDAEEKETDYSHWLGRCYTEFVEYYGEKGLTTKAEKYAKLLFDEYTKQKQDRYAEYLKLRYAKEYLLFADELVKQLEAEIKNPDQKKLSQSSQDLAAIYAKMGKTEKAKKSLYDLYENQSLVESMDEKKKASFYNSIAWTMVEAKIVEQKTLEIAKKAAELKESPDILDTLATIHAELGNFEEAVKIEEKALKLEEREYLIEEFKKKLENWKKKR